MLKQQKAEQIIKLFANISSRSVHANVSTDCGYELINHVNMDKSV